MEWTTTRNGKPCVFINRVQIVEDSEGHYTLWLGGDFPPMIFTAERPPLKAFDRIHAEFQKHRKDAS